MFFNLFLDYLPHSYKNIGSLVLGLIFLLVFLIQIGFIVTLIIGLVGFINNDLRRTSVIYILQTLGVGLIIYVLFILGFALND